MGVDLEGHVICTKILRPGGQNFAATYATGLTIPDLIAYAEILFIGFGIQIAERRTGRNIISYKLAPTFETCISWTECPKSYAYARCIQGTFLSKEVV